MRVLVLGGTVFLGRHLLGQLVARGHSVTTFNRGTHAVDAELPVGRITGDRTDLAHLRRIPADGWDAVIDPSSDDPDVVQAAAAHLAGAGRYIYISSVSAYQPGRAPVDEQSPLIRNVEGAPHASTAEAFGWRKATSEARVETVFGSRATLVRPGLIVGPYDPTDRFTYWPVRIARGGHIIVPAPPGREVQFIDVRDVAAFIVRTLESDLAGPYNVTSARGSIAMRDVIDACRDDVEVLPAIRWVDGDFLVAEGCAPWSDLPLWLPTDSVYAALFAADTARATNAGLTLRPLIETIRATREWFARSGRTTLSTGLEPAREKELLERWNAVISS